MDMPTRGLTAGEISLLQSVYASTLPLSTQQITNNWICFPFDCSNSYTPGGTPHYSCQIWCADFSGIDLTNKTKDSNGWVNSDKVWTFVHEFGHVWQSTYGPSAWQGALALWLSNNCTGYEKLYAYDLTMSTSLFDYNIEQAASIFADYWSLSNGVTLSNGKNTLYCNNSNPQVSSYSGFISQMQNPPPPPVPQNVEPSDGGAPPGGTS
jgi:hypothetical protein